MIFNDERVGVPATLRLGGSSYVLAGDPSERADRGRALDESADGAGDDGRWLCPPRGPPHRLGQCTTHKATIVIL